MKVLILGGTGVISTGITRELVSRGDEVTLFNRGSRPHTFDEAVREITGDRNVGADLARTLEGGPYDAVVDMICFTPAQARLAIDVFAGSARHFVFCSTVDVYTKRPARYPIAEDAPREPSPRFSYAFDKARCEHLFEAANSDGDFAVTILRPAATYLDSAVAPLGTYQLYVERLARGLPVIVHGDGSSIWVVAHRDDVAGAFVNALGNEAAFSKSYNVAGAELLTWDTYWGVAAGALGISDPEFLHVPTDALASLAPRGSAWCVENFQYNNIFDNSAAHRDLGYVSRTSWREGAEGLRKVFPAAVPEAVSRDFDALIEAWKSQLDGSIAAVSRLDL